MKFLAPAISLIVWVLIVGLAAVFGAQFTPGEWYAGLQKPSWNPPNWIFGPVWTALYLGMAVAAWLIWLRRQQEGAHFALAVFALQLLLNALWSWLFFGLHRMGLAFADIAVLLFLIGLNVRLFWKHSKPAAMLLAPYFAWVSFASVLNLALWRMNP